MPDWAPSAALILWGPVCFAAFSALRPALACACIMLGATMLLPVGAAFDLPSVPPLGRQELTCLFILISAMISCPNRLTSAIPGRGLESLVIVLMLGALATAASNPDSLEFGILQLPAITMRDGVSNAIRDMVRYALPFFIGRAFFRSQRDVRDLFMVAAAACLLYSLLILFELRMSPQLHRWTYGYFQHGFAGTVRYGGYRPMVYMSNGLELSLFVATATIMSAAFVKAMRSARRSDATLGVPGRFRTPYLLVILVMCKSIASILYGLVGTATVAWAKPRTVMRVAVILSVLVTAYPMMRASETFPTASLLDVVRAVDEERWHSLEFRFRNESMLLERARERPIFGWGGFRRSRIFDHRGIDRSKTDGYWIIMLGKRGAVGFACTFGLLLIPVVTAFLRFSSIRSPVDRILISALGLVVALHMVDLLPNGLFSYRAVFFAGALSGALRRLRRASRKQPRRASPAMRAPVPEPQGSEDSRTLGEAAASARRRR